MYKLPIVISWGRKNIDVLIFFQFQVTDDTEDRVSPCWLYTKEFNHYIAHIAKKKKKIKSLLSIMVLIENWFLLIIVNA